MRILGLCAPHPPSIPITFLTTIWPSDCDLGTIINQVALREIVVVVGENLQEAVDSSETRCR